MIVSQIDFYCQKDDFLHSDCRLLGGNSGGPRSNFRLGTYYCLLPIVGCTFLRLEILSDFVFFFPGSPD